MTDPLQAGGAAPRPGPAPGPHQHTAFDNAPVGMAVATPDGVITACNPALGRLLDRDPRSVVGGTFFDVTHPDDLPGARRSCTLMRGGTTPVLRHECRFVRPDGAVVWVLISTSMVPAAGTRPAHLIMLVEDVSDRKALEAELTRRALHDPLTGLPNRTLLTERIAAAARATGHGARPYCLFYVDLNGFKGVNDRYGHVAGDEVLRQLAARISALLGPQDTAARLGGDEFAVLCVDTAPEHAAAVADRLRAVAAEPFAVDGHAVALSAAVGISTSGPAAGSAHLDPLDLLRQADLSMYETKRQVRGERGLRADPLGS